MFGVTIARSSKSAHASRIAVTRGVMRAVDLADDDGGAAAVENHARLHVIGAEIDERADGALRARRSRAMVSSLSPFCTEITQPVRAQVRQERARRGFGVVRLGREHDRVPRRRRPSPA